MQPHLWIITVLQDIIDYCLLNNLKDSGLMMLMVRDTIENELQSDPDIKSTNIIEFPLPQKPLTKVQPSPLGL